MNFTMFGGTFSPISLPSSISLIKHFLPSSPAVAKTKVYINGDTFWLHLFQVQARKNPVELQTLLLLITIWMIIFEDSRLPNSPLPQASRLPNSPPTPYWPCHTCDLIFLDGNKNYCSITAMPGSLLLPNWLIILYVCLSSLPPPPPFVSFFLRVTLSEEEEGVGWSRSNFGPPLPLPPRLFPNKTFL